MVEVNTVVVVASVRKAGGRGGGSGNGHDSGNAAGSRACSG